MRDLRQALEQEEKPPVKSYCGGKANYCTPEVTPEVTGDVDAVNISQERVDETAKREHEPLVWMNKYGHVASFQNEEYKDPLYTAPPKHEWVGLTEEETIDLLPVGEWEIEPTLVFAKAIEAKLKEKNT